MGDVAQADGWESTATLQRCYQHPDEATILAVVLGGAELREVQAQGPASLHTVLAHCRVTHRRGVAQPGSASGLGPEGPGFKSRRPDSPNHHRGIDFRRAAFSSSSHVL